MKTPMSSDTKLTKDEECESVDSTKYRGTIGSLLYLTASRTDIMFSVYLCARFQEALITSHLKAKQTTLAISTTEAEYGVVTRIRHEQEIVVEDNQILTREITDIMKTWVDIIWENIFCLGGNWDHVPACLCYMPFSIDTSTKYNLAFFIAKRMELVTKQARLILPY
ncbi:hypothetical protein Tco_1432974, partial [Tanacetum coccineum]